MAARPVCRSQPRTSSAISIAAVPGQSRFTTQRKEPDEVRILSGVFDNDAGEQVTTGTAIGLLIENVDQRSKDYGDIKDKYRPGTRRLRL